MRLYQWCPPDMDMAALRPLARLAVHPPRGFLYANTRSEFASKVQALDLRGQVRSKRRAAELQLALARCYDDLDVVSTDL